MAWHPSNRTHSPQAGIRHARRAGSQSRLERDPAAPAALERSACEALDATRTWIAGADKAHITRIVVRNERGADPAKAVKDARAAIERALLRD